MTPSTSPQESCIGAVINQVPLRTSHNRSAARTPAVREIEIMTAARAGSPVAFDELQRAYSARLFAVILRITKNREDAEDALQDTFLRAFAAFGCFEARSSIYSWLTRIAINSALMILRRRRSRREVFSLFSPEDREDELPMEVADPALDPEQLCDLQQRSRQMHNAIRDLEPRLRKAIEIQLAGGPTMKEIADSLNISVAAAKARLFRARARLARRVPLRPVTKDTCHRPDRQRVSHPRQTCNA